LELTAAEPRGPQPARAARENRDHPPVLAGERGVELDDAGRARVRGERFGECGPDPAPLQLVRDLEPDVRGVTLPDEACDRRRSRIALDVRDEDVVTMVDARERFELRLGQMRLRGGEP